MEDRQKTRKKKEYLKSYILLSAEAESLKEQIAAFRTEMQNVKTQIYSDRIRTHGTSDLSDKFAQEEFLLDKWEKDHKRKVARCGEIYGKIELMSDETEKIILKMHYLRKLSFEKISETLNLSTRQVYRIHQRALEHFQMEGEEAEREG